MSKIDRRRFLQLAGGATAMSLLPASIARAASIPAARRTGTLRDVEHVVVLMQENRSFDHYFGTMRGVRGFGDPHPVQLPSGKSVWHQFDGTREVLPFHPTADDLGMQFLQDLPHGWNDGHEAWNGGRYDQWIPAKSATTMAYLRRDDIPFHYALADAFTVCDAYHCSLIGPTDPNRYYMWTGYTGNDGAGAGPVLANDELGYSWTTYPERLEAAGVSWRVYQDEGDGLDADGFWGWTGDPYIGNYGDNSLLYFDQYRTAAPGDPLYDRARVGTKAKAGDDLFGQLAADVLADRLPQVSYVVAPEAFSEHPNWPVNYGAWYIAKVLDALTANPEVWSRTALFINYDENDGFFDHVVPAYPPTTPAQGASTTSLDGEIYRSGKGFVTGPYGLGQRVPLLVVSPWSTGGWVCSQVFDHTSIVRFMEQRFGVHEPNISAWRRAVCGDLTTAFDFSHVRTAPPRLPDTSGYAPTDHDRHGDYIPDVPAEQLLPAQEPGVRAARALPYDLAADAFVGPGSRLRVEFASLGTAGANFFVTSATEAGGPWTYTVEERGRVTGSWQLGSPSYDLQVHGPNGFFRHLAGTTTHAGAEVETHHDSGGGSVRLVLTNSGRAPVHLTVSDGYGYAQPVVYRVSSGHSVVHTAECNHTAQWYDLQVTSDVDPAYLRRAAGHVETGEPSTSDPALTGRAIAAG